MTKVEEKEVDCEEEGMRRDDDAAIGRKGSATLNLSRREGGKA